MQAIALKLCGSISGIKCKIHKLPTSRADIEHVRALVSHDAYFGGCNNASVLYFKCTGVQRGYYLDVNSMYPLNLLCQHLSSFTQ